MKIRYYGHVGQATGYGVAASDMCMALLRAGADLQIRPLAPPNAFSLPDRYLPLANHVHREDTLDPHPDAIVVHTLPLDCRRVLETIGMLETRPANDPRVVAYTTWEAAGPSQEVHAALRPFDQVWSPSCATAVLGDAPRSLVMPHCFDEETLARRRAGRLPQDRFRFYYIGAWTARKNPAALIRTFVHTFGKDDPVELVLRCNGMSAIDFAIALHGTGVDESDMPKISLIDGYQSDSMMMTIHQTMDCFVTASHGEAWNLPAFDAMLSGRHVIAPAGQGSDEFLKGTSADMYPTIPGIPQLDVRVNKRDDGPRVDLEIIGAQGLSARLLWQEPSLTELSAYMRAVAVNKVRDINIGYNPCERFGYSAIGSRALSYLTKDPS